MKGRNFFAVLLVSLAFFAAGHTYAATGFVDSPLWLSPESPKEDETVKLTAVFRNAERETLSGEVLFYDGETLISKKPVTILGNDVSTISATFTISAGAHQFSATVNNMSKLTTSGRLEVIVIPKATAELPEQFVSRKIDLAAQAGNDSDQAASPILKRIDDAQNEVLEVIPEGIKESVGSTMSAFDAWRVKTAQSFGSSRDDAKLAIERSKVEVKTTVPSVLGSKEGGKPVQTKIKNTASPAEYVKLFFFGLFALLFSKAFAFYLVSVLVAYIVLRFLFRRIGRLVGRRGKQRPEKA